jgi:hypothetical protein
MGGNILWRKQERMDGNRFSYILLKGTVTGWNKQMKKTCILKPFSLGTVRRQRCSFSAVSSGFEPENSYGLW